MNVHLTSAAVAQDEVPGARVVARHVGVSAGFEQSTQLGDISGIDEDVEVAVGSRLFAQERVDPPATVDPDVDS